MENTEKKATTAREIICRLIDEKAITGEEAIVLIEQLVKKNDNITLSVKDEPYSPWKYPYTPCTTTTPKSTDWITYTNNANTDATCCCHQHNCCK